MNISRVRWTAYHIPFRTPYVTSRGVVTHREGLFLELTTETGVVGYGEAAPDPALGISAAVLAATLQDVSQHLLGADLDELAITATPDPTGAVDPCESAIACAIEVATLDARAATAGVTLAALLDAAAVAAPVAVNALVTAADAAVAQNEAAVARRAGFGAVKLKVAVTPSLDAERARVAAVRDVIGPDVKLRLDPNGGWSEAQAIAAIRAFHPYDIEYVEQPVAPGHLDALARVQAAVETPIAADEDLTDLSTAERIVAARAVSVLVLKPQRLGGLQTCLEVAGFAQAAGVECVITTSIETGIGTAACLQLAGVLPDRGLAHGLATTDHFVDDLITPHLRIEGGRMRPADGPGLGVRLDTQRATPYLGAWQEAI